MSRYIEYVLISDGGRETPTHYGYYIVPVYRHQTKDPEWEENVNWIEENLTDRWSWFAFGGYPKPGISFCFRSKIDAAIFILCRV